MESSKKPPQFPLGADQGASSERSRRALAAVDAAMLRARASASPVVLRERLSELTINTVFCEPATPSNTR